MLQQTNVVQQTIYYHKTTTNKSFMDVHYYLKDTGIDNNAFFLVLFDPDLAHINPRDPRINTHIKQKILRECMINYWYFLRECIRIPDQGGSSNGGMQYKLHRGNLALNFCLVNNWNIFAEFPRQHGKTIAVICRILWEFIFGTTNSEMMLINKKHDDSKLNLQRLKEIREALPSYLQMSGQFGTDGKRLKVKDSVEVLSHPTNGNRVKTLAAARNKVNANSLGRGCTQPRQWYDEYAFIPYNNIIYLSATPAFKTASMNAKNNNAPYGIVITTTPGDMTTDQGLSAFNMKEHATPFSEKWYDFTPDMLRELLSKNEDSNFIYIRYTYQQLGSSEQWFKEICIDMQKDWDAIRREVLLEWSESSDNSPFTKEDLAIVKALTREPISTIMLANFYQFNIYKQLDPRAIPLVGVDVSGGFQKDSSAITVVESTTTEVTADMNCNYISTPDLAKVLYELVTKYMPRSVINIERNGGFGASVLATLLKTSIKRNLYYEIKDRVVEERYNGANTITKKQKTKVYGTDNTKNTREQLMDILRRRMDNHKDKFISPIIYKELQTLEVKKNGRVEHSSNGHDDQIFSYLYALYIWYCGQNVMENWGIQKSALKTDEEAEETIVRLEEKYSDLTEDIEIMDEDNPSQVKQQLDYLNSYKSMSYEQWATQEFNNEQKATQQLLNSKLGRIAYSQKYHCNVNDMENGMTQIPDEIFTNFNE